MRKEISFAGQTARHSDYDVVDGALETSANMLWEDGALRPLLPPRSCGYKLPSGSKAVATHWVEGRRNIVLYSADDGKLLYFTVGEDGSATETNDKGYAVCSEIEASGEIGDGVTVAGVGNVLAISHGGKLEYAFWTDGGYRWLGEKPQMPVIEFGLQSAGGLPFNGTSYRINKLHLHGQNTPGQQVGSRAPSEAQDVKSTYALICAAMSAAMRDAANRRRFAMPFYVRYALRLYDGRHIMPSPPVLMLPTVLPPCLTPATYEETETYGVATFTGAFAQAYKLRCCIHSDCEAAWASLVQAVDIFATAPILTYKPGLSDEDSQTHYGLRTYRGIAEEAAKMLTKDGTAPDDDSLLVGRFSDASGVHRDHYLSNIDGMADAISWYFAPSDHLMSDLERASEFYKIGSIPYEDIRASSEFADAPIDGPLSDITTKERLEDDYLSHYGVHPQSVYAYNSRLHVACSSLSMPAPYDLAAYGAAGNENLAQVGTNMTAWVYSKNGGHSCVKRASMGMARWSFGTGFPRYVYYPDATAYKMVLYNQVGNKYYSIGLKPHPTPNGAYWMAPMTKGYAPSELNAAPALEGVGEGVVPYHNKALVSDPSNPFIFPARGIATVGLGRLLGLSAVTAALSQGQFGQFPLYAFSSEGVWALSVSADGSVASVHPVSRDVCADPSTITQLDNAVAFASERGLMLLRGSECVCLTADLWPPYGTRGGIAGKLSGLLPAAQNRDHRLGAQLWQPRGLAPLAGSLIAYDYAGGRLRVFRKGDAMAYVYSLASGQWGVELTKAEDVMAGYPDTLVVLEGGEVATYSGNAAAGDASVPVLLLTRPVKIVAADKLKTVTDAIIRGDFAPGKLSVAIYGSRDLEHWHAVASSRTSEIRGVRGTPYKYFRLAAFGSLHGGESVTGATLAYDLRRAGRLL